MIGEVSEEKWIEKYADSCSLALMFLGFLERSRRSGPGTSLPSELYPGRADNPSSREVDFKKKLSIEIAFNGAAFRQRVGEMGIREVLTVARSPWQNPHAELRGRVLSRPQGLSA